MGALAPQPDEPPLLVGDVRRLSEEVGWRPRYRTDGLQHTIEWWKNRQMDWAMQTSLTTDELADYVSSQLNYLFPDGRTIQLREHRSSVDLALDRVAYSFKHSAVRHYCVAGEPRFNHLFSDQYAAFLWFLANTLWKARGAPVLDKLFCLNKALHAFECMYDTLLPDIFFLSHTVGTVLGKALMPISSWYRRAVRWACTKAIPRHEQRHRSGRQCVRNWQLHLGQRV